MKRLTAWLLTFGIIVAIVANSTDFFFHRPYYEFWDLAANSLAINRAKHFAELYGSYSRWGFHHPGPVFFYIQAFGEWFFYDVLHISPAPFNAQTLANLCVTTSFFVAAVAVFSRWVSDGARRWFVPAALAVAAVHFGAVSRVPSYDMLLGSSVFTSAWTAHSWVFPFLCVVTAGASVAAGRGQDLPLLALADGFLIHAHIAAPMFVGPMTLLAYVGLLMTTSGRAPMPTLAAEGGAAAVRPLWRRAAWTLGSAWRAFPRLHVAALVILALFASPMVIDLFLGDASNFHAVLMHMRGHQGEHKSLARALFFFGQFGAYRPFKAHVHEFKRFDAAGAYAYLWYHKKIYAAWFVAILIVIWCSAVRPALVALGRWREEDATPPAVVADETASAVTTPVRTRFLAWAGAFLVLSILLTLYWGTIQDGGMFYYSSWINFAIYYFGLLIILAEFSAVLALGVTRWRGGALLHRTAWRWTERLLPVALLVFACFMEAKRFRVSDPTPEVNRAMHESFVRVVQDAKTRNPKGIKILMFPILAWPTLTGLALEMEREHVPYMIASVYPVAFGKSGAMHPTTKQEQELMEVWHFKVGKMYKLWVSGVPKWFVSRGERLEQQLAAAKLAKPTEDGTVEYPLLNDVELRIDLPKVDPTDGMEADATLDFRKRETNPDMVHYGYYKHDQFSVLVQELESSPGSALYGFSEPESWGMWNRGPDAMLRLNGTPVDPSENVEIHLAAHPFLAPQAGLIAQRLFLAVNGTLLGPPARLTKDDDVVFTVPGALWNRTFGQNAGAALEFGFPDVSSPAATNPDVESDTRLLGVGFRDIRFHTVPAEHPQPTLDLEDSNNVVTLDFKPGGNAPTFQGEGWYKPEPWGTWTRGHTSSLRFHSELVEGTHDVEITLDIHSVMDTDSGVKGQRIRVSLGGNSVDRERVMFSAGKLVLTVPSAVWNSAVADGSEAELTLELPDAVSPARLDPAGKEEDQRQLAIGIERISLREVKMPAVTSR